MEINQDIDLAEEEKDGVQSDETDDETDKDDEFEYDDDGNIIIPDIIDDEDRDEDAADIDEDQNEAGEGDDDFDVGAKEPKESKAEPGGRDEKDARIEELQRRLEALEPQVKEYEALKAQSADTLEKLGIKSNNVLEGLEKVAAESDDMSLEAYRRKKAEEQRDEDARKLYQRVEFEKKMKADLEEIQREYPETRGLKSLTEIENLAKFGRFRDLGLSAKEAYAAANADSVRKSVAAATKQQSLNATKAHLRSAVPAGSKDDSITISRKELSAWRDLFPHLSDKQIVRLYKESAKK